MLTLTCNVYNRDAQAGSWHVNESEEQVEPDLKSLGDDYRKRDDDVNVVPSGRISSEFPRRADSTYLCS